MILSCHHIQKAFLSNVILRDASFHLEEREKAALVGINGAGKSTLLKIIMGQVLADKGEVALAKGKTIGYLAQYQEVQSGQTIYDTLLEGKRDVLEMEQKLRRMEQQMKEKTGSQLEAFMDSYARLSHAFEQADGYALRSEITGILKGLGFSEEEFQKPVSSLSGGQMTRVSLGRLLLSKPDIILLDEPTNHLDVSSISWLEAFLSNYPGSVLIVSHDRYFLNRIVTKVIEVEAGEVTTYLGNYTDYAAKKAQMREIRMKAYLNQQAQIRHQEEVIEKLRSFNREKSIKRAESRVKMLDRMERLEKPVDIHSEMNLTLEPETVSGNDVLITESLSKSFGAVPLFSHADIHIRRGERVAIIGKNGTGKSTFLKIINGLLPADSGVFHLGSQVQIGYYDQETHVLHEEKTLFEELQDEHPDMNNTRVRNILAAFLFTGDDVFKKIRDLSGGERGRVSLAKLMLSRANFLILDEPTNHLDIPSKEILEQALSRYTGTVLYVSHDRYFVNQTATRILELEDGHFTSYLGNYDYYLEKKQEQKTPFQNSSRPSSLFGQRAPVSPSGEGETSSKADWKAKKEEQARLRKRQNDLKRTEEQIEKLEERQKEIDSLLVQEEIYTNPAKLMELNQEKTGLSQKLEELYALWEELAE